MKKVLWHALTLSLVGLVSCGEIAVFVGSAHAGGGASPVSGSRSVFVSGTAMPVGRRGTSGSGALKRRWSRARRAPHSQWHPLARTVKPRGAAVTHIASGNVITGIAVVPDESTVRLVIEGSRDFTPVVTCVSNGGITSTVVHVPGVLSDEAGVGSVAVHKNGVYTLRYANQPMDQVRFVASTQSELVATAIPGADRKHWEIVLRRPAVERYQVAMDTTGGKGVPVLSARKATPVVFKPAVASRHSKPTSGSAVRAEGSVKPVTITFPGVVPKLASGSAPGRSAKPVPMFIPSRAAAPIIAGNSARMRGSLPPALVGQPQAATPGTGEDKRVSLDVVAADINDVIKALALQSGINVVTSTEVKGSITVSLKRVPMIEALDTITRLSGYQYARLNSGYIVGSPASVAALTAVAREAPMVTEYVRYRYVSSADLYNTLRSRFPGLQLPATGANDGNPALSKLLVLTDTKERIDKVRVFVDELDRQAADQIDTQVTELYKIKAANAQDLIRLVQQLAPSVVIQVGPAQSFQASGSGQSASFSSGAAYGPVANSAGAGATGVSSGGGATGGPGNTQNGAGINSPTTLVLTGTVASIAKARQILERIDVRTPQIAYEARVVDVNRQDAQQLGLSYDFSRPVNVGERNETGQGTLGVPSGALPASNPNFGAILRSPYTVGVILDALATQNRARTLASPNLSAIDGQPATVFIGDQLKYVISVQQTPQGPTIQTETATVGITLKVTGKSSPDGYITLYIHPEVSSITSFANLGNGIQLPQISTRFVDTTVRVKSGETIAIGGLIREQDINNLQKVPIIGDLPFFGKLFRRTNKSKSRSEIVIFVTAKTTEDGG